MPRPNQHVIKQQVLQLDVPYGPDAHNVLQAVAQRLRTHSMPGIEALFDRFTNPEQTIRLQRVEINLGNLDETDWQQQFESGLVAQLTDILKKATADHAEQSSATQSDKGGYGKDKYGKDKYSENEYGEDEFRQLLYFLGHGRLPSWSKSVADNWPSQWLQQLDSTQWKSLRRRLSSNTTARQRLIHTLDDTGLVIAVEKLLGLAEVQKVFNSCFPAELSRDKQLVWRTQFWLALLNPVTADGDESGIEIMQRLLQLQTSFYRPSFNRPATITGEASAILPELPEPWCDWLAKIQRNPQGVHNISARGVSESKPVTDLTRQQSTPEGTAEIPAESPGESPGTPAPHTQHVADTGINEASRLQTNTAQPVSPLDASRHISELLTENTQIEIGEVVSVNGAGCILLHPFLRELFSSTNLLDGDDFRDAASRQRAVHLLSYLTFGEQPAEYELLLPKLLCGLAWHEPLAPVELSDEECHACDQLLDAVIEHWQALKGCSANWLREQFLLRPARLEQTDDAWQLTVERRAQDVLLDRLPWGLGVISLPWRHGLIYVRWTE